MSINLTDIICTICGQSPEKGAPRKVGEWDDAGHTDGAHEPSWSQESFPGSIWMAHPQRALWYGEVIVAKPGEDTDYFSGYADCEDEPSVDELIPAGWEVLESTVKPTPNNPAWKPGQD